MADLAALLAQVRAAVSLHGEGWLQAGLGAPAAADVVLPVVPPVRERSRRSRPPERLSPDVTPRIRRRIRSPSGDPLTPAAGRSPSPAGRSVRRNPRAHRDPAGAGGRVLSSPSPYHRGRAGSRAAVLPDVAPVREAARRGASSRSGAAAARAQEGAGCSSSESRGAVEQSSVGQESAAVRRGQPQERGRRLDSPAGGAGRAPSAAALQRQEERRLAEEQAVASAEEGEFEGSSSPDLDAVPVVASVVSRPEPGRSGGTVGSEDCRSTAAAGGSAQGQPGERSSMFLGGVGGSFSQHGVEGSVQEFLGSLGRLLAGWGTQASGGQGSPAAVWTGLGVPGVGGGASGMQGSGDAVVATESGVVAAGTSAGVPLGEGETEVEKEAGLDKRKEVVRIADAAQGQVYVCYEGPLGVHLKAEVREKIWKDEYVEIFSLLPLEKFNLDRVKPEDTKSKKDDEEKRRYRLIPRTFSNWLQAFAILASVIGEKAPENCSALFCYMDSIGEAFRVYGGVAWLRYDEQFRQRKAVRTSLKWDHKDISLWMRLMAAPRMGGSQSFPGSAGGSSAGGFSAGGKKGACWQFNEGFCKFASDCKFKHECSGCGGAHSLSRCFKRGKGRGLDASKRGDAGEGSRDAALSRDVSK